MEDNFNQNIWKNIVDRLNNLEMTIATMESCTGGGIANKITNISGASAIIKESYVTYSNEAKIKQGVAREVIEKYTVYSPETAVEMAKAVKKNANEVMNTFCAEHNVLSIIFSEVQGNLVYVIIYK